ncbi:AraC family transcriptional regulator [Nocardia sp. NPDC046763]|uniref:AraC family transcriptional regulator n=1 Tax=Nocardia sp. NPDC046763 TaxID=3155256 RepID=UPI0033F84E64
MSARTVPIHFVLRLLREAERRGLDAMPLVLASGLTPAMMDNPQARATVDQMSVLTRAVWKLTGDELFGLGPSVPRGTLNLLGISLVHAEDLRDVIARACEGTAVMSGAPDITAEFGVERTRVEIDLSRLDDPEHLGSESMMAMLHRFVGWLIGRRIVLRSIEFPYPAPPHADFYDVIFGRTPIFGARQTAMTFDSELLTLPVVRTEREMREFVRAMPMTWYSTRDDEPSTGERVRRVLERGLKGEWPTSEDIAARLAVSVPHLRRLLREEGTSVSRIKEEILRDAAVASLVRGEESVEDLAQRLGFSEASAFRRAFRRWTGSPPGAYRSGGE